ncbi:MAG: sigma-70 family RNA polymerase sigma factor [Myxococcota bacterium]
MSTELELLDAWRRGDREAGGALLRSQFDALFRFFRSKAAPELVSELVQQTMMQCIENRDAFRGEARFSTYVMAIARRVLIASYRRRAHQIQGFDSNAVSVAELDPSPSAILADHEQQRLLLRALRSIPLDHQILLELHYWEKFSGPALAVALDVPEGTVRTRLRRARQLLTEAMRRAASDARIAETTASELEHWAQSLRDVVQRSKSPT